MKSSRLDREQAQVCVSVAVLAFSSTHARQLPPKRSRGGTYKDLLALEKSPDARRPPKVPKAGQHEASEASDSDDEVVVDAPDDVGEAASEEGAGEW